MRITNEKVGKIGKVEALLLTVSPLLCVLIGTVTALFSSQYTASSTSDSPSHMNAKVLPVIRQSQAAIHEYDTEIDLLAGSIMTLLKSYYVDRDRVSYHNIVGRFAATMNALPSIKTVVDANEMKILTPNAAYIVSLSDGNNLDDLVPFIRQVSSLTLGDEWMKNILSPRDSELSYVNWTERLLNLMLESLDAHSNLLSTSEYRELKQGTDGAFGGLGILVGMKDEILTVVKPLPYSPAKKIGLQRLDRILSIDKANTFGTTIDRLVDFMRGDPGTKVKIVVLREGLKHPVELTLNREIIQVDSVQIAKVSQDNLDIAHIKVDAFTSRTARDLLGAIRHFKRKFKDSFAGVILDLRGNPGGLLDQAVQVADLFLNRGPIVHTKGRRDETEVAGSGIDFLDLPLVVLTNAESASASEIVAGALQDHNRALIVGEPSFGKGSVQTVFELPHEKALKLTIARYYTPSGRSIQNVGIIPDIWLQPIYRNEKNINLLGRYRYRNEAFLRNHLADRHETDSITKSIAKAKKFYYISKNQPPDVFSEAIEDKELDFAKVILASTHKNSSDFAHDLGRAGYVESLSSPFTSKIISKDNADVAKWLKDAFNVQWVMGNHMGDQNALAIDASFDEAKSYHEGGQLALQVKVVNFSKSPVDRLSIIIDSETNAFEPTEILAGRLGPDSSRTLQAKVEIPNYSRDPFLHVKVTPVVGGWPISTAAKSLVAAINKVERSSIELVHLFDDGGEGKKGVLEADEFAKLKIQVRNTGSSPIKDMKLQLTNLNGTQVGLENAVENIRVISPSETKTVAFSIKASPMLFKETMSFGFSADALHLQQPVRKVFTVPSKTNQNYDYGINTLSH